MHSVLVLHSFDKPDVLLDLGDKRTEFVFQLIAVFEQTQSIDRFKLYYSQQILIKEQFNIKEAKAVEQGEVAEDAKVSDEFVAESYFDQVFKSNYTMVD